jgi:hypothetical protein
MRKQDPYQHLLARARRAPQKQDTTTPLGFATRMAALRPRPEPWNPLELWAALMPKALGITALACLLALVFCRENRPLLQEETLFVLADPTFLITGGF